MERTEHGGRDRSGGQGSAQGADSTGLPGSSSKVWTSFSRGPKAMGGN